MYRTREGSRTTPPGAAIIAIGSEMLGPLRQDTNSLWLTARLEEVGIPTVRKSVVGDDPDAILAELRNARSAARYVFTTGGLGPTADDITVATVARGLGLLLRRDEAFLSRMRARFESRGIPMPACNEKQADFIVGARVLENPRGTAPGFWISGSGNEILILPGVPAEMREIIEEIVLPALRESAGGVAARRRVLRIAGMGESAVEERVAPVYEKWKESPVTILALPGEVQLHLCVWDEPSRAQDRLRAMEADFRAALGPALYGSDEEDLASCVGQLLREKGKTLALAESCTGGLISMLLTEVPGSSDYFLGAVVPYADSAKGEILGVSEETLRAHGAVSEQAALEMARGAREKFNADLGVSVTGIAGPGGGTPEKPVGTVVFAIVDRGGFEMSKRRSFVGDRASVRRASSAHALEMVRRRLLGIG